MGDVRIRSGGRPRQLYADKNYNAILVREYLKRRDVKTRMHRRSRKPGPGRPTVIDKASYRKHRSSVERFFSMLKGGLRRLAKGTRDLHLSS